MATHWVGENFDAELCDSVETVAQRIGGQNCLAMVLWRHCCPSNGLSHYGNPLGLWKIRHWVMWWCDKVEAVAQGEIGVKIVWPWLLDKIWHHCCHSYGLCLHGNQLVSGEFDSESCDSVETVAQRRIVGQNRLTIVLWCCCCCSAYIYHPATGQRQTLTCWTIRTLFITRTTSWLEESAPA